MRGQGPHAPSVRDMGGIMDKERRKKIKEIERCPPNVTFVIQISLLN
jgi:hypothetical protein